MRRHISLNNSQCHAVMDLDDNVLASINDARYLNLYVDVMPGFNFVQTFNSTKSYTAHIYYVDTELLAKVSLLNVKSQLSQDVNYITETYLNLLIDNANTDMYVMFIKRKRVKENGTTNLKQGARKTPPRHAVKSVPHRW